MAYLPSSQGTTQLYLESYLNPSIQLQSGGSFLNLPGKQDTHSSSLLQFSQGAIHGLGAHSGSPLS